LISLAITGEPRTPKAAAFSHASDEPKVLIDLPWYHTGSYADLHIKSGDSIETSPCDDGSVRLNGGHSAALRAFRLGPHDGFDDTSNVLSLRKYCQMDAERQSTDLNTEMRITCTFRLVNRELG